MSDNNKYLGIVARLRGLQSRLAAIECLYGVIKTAIIKLLLVGILVLITAIIWPGTAIRAAADILFLSIIGLTAFFLAITPLIRRQGFLDIARRLEIRYGRFQSRLIGALELYDKAKANRENYSLELIEKTIEEAGDEIGRVDMDSIIDYRPIKRAGWQLGAIAAIFLIGLIIKPQLVFQTAQLYMNPLTEFIRPPEFAFEIEPASGEYYRNQDLTVSAYPEGVPPRNVQIFFRYEDGIWTNEPMARTQDSTIAFSYTFKKVRKSFEVYARSGSIESQKIRYDIIEPLRVVDLKIKLDFPDYTGAPDMVNNLNDGNISAIRGTKASLEAQSNRKLSEGFLIFADSSRQILDIVGDRMTTQIKVMENARYSLQLTDVSGRINPEPIWYDIQSLEDFPPSIDITFPGTDVNLNDQMMVPLEVEINDDYGFNTLNLVWWIFTEGQQTEPSKTPLKIADISNSNQLIKTAWDLQELGLIPGDLAYYYCEVSDNDYISGPKWSKSKTYAARLPSLDEILAEVGQTQENQRESLEEVLKEQKELQKQINEAAREMSKASEMTYDEQQKAGKALEKQKELAEKLDKIAQEMQENLEKLEDNSLISEKIAEKMQELQRLMEEIAPPEMKEAMKKLNEALQNMDPEQMKKALEQMQLTSEQLLENLERSVALLQKLEMEQKLDMLAEIAERLAEDQNKINEKISQTPDSSGLCEQSGAEKNIGEEFDVMKQEFNDLMEMDETTQMIPSENKMDADSKINDPQTPQDISEMASGMCKNSKGNCQKKGRKLEQDFKEMASSLRNAQEAMQEQERADVTRKIQKAAEDLLYLSNRQEALLDSTKSYEKISDEVRKMTLPQAQLLGASARITEQVSEISKETIFITMALMKTLGEVLSGMDNASINLDRRNSVVASQQQQSAMSNLNIAVMMLMQAAENASNSSSGSGMQEMMQKLQQMSQMQSGINQQTLFQIPKPGAQMSQNQQQALQRLAAEQEMMRKQLQEMTDQYGKRGEMLGRLDALGEEMKKVSEDLAKSKVDRTTIERQEKILSRLLDAQKSVNRRDFSQKRKAEEGLEAVRRSPSEFEESILGDDWFSNAIRNAMEEKYPRQYDKLIKAYLKSLQTQGAETGE